MFIQCKGSMNRLSWYHGLVGWVLEVDEKTVDTINGIKCAERYVLTPEQVVRLREIFGINFISTVAYVPCDEADEVSVFGNKGNDSNFVQALMNVAKQHGYEINYIDWHTKSKNISEE